MLKGCWFEVESDGVLSETVEGQEQIFTIELRPLVVMQKMHSLKCFIGGLLATSADCFAGGYLAKPVSVP